MNFQQRSSPGAFCVLLRVSFSCQEQKQEYQLGDFPGGTVFKNLPANAGDTGSIPGPGRSHMLWSN